MVSFFHRLRNLLKTLHYLYISTPHWANIRSEVINLEIEILFVQAVDRRIVIHTMDEAYIGPLTKQLELLLRQFGFERADSNKFVQMNKIIRRDKKKKKVYFDEEKTKYCPITRPNMKKFF